MEREVELICGGKDREWGRGKDKSKGKGKAGKGGKGKK